MSVIEFGLIAPILAFTVMGIVDCANGFARKYKIEQATYRTLEMVTGSRNTVSTADLRSGAASAAGEPEANVAIDTWLECDSVKAPAATLNCTATQQTARFVQVTIFSDFQPSFSYGPLGTAFGANSKGTVRLTARSTVRVQ
ncbi:MAG TPA: hypothetical protein VGR19_04970 [Allosphingosinicella sp.]|nr:hypothetical protein [Allosphingosinicella sp.]